MDTPHVAKRMHGLTAFLADISNSALPNKRPRRCSQKAITQITEQVKPKASRGVHATTHSQLQTCTEEEHSVSLKYLVNKRSDFFRTRSETHAELHRKKHYSSCAEVILSPDVRWTGTEFGQDTGGLWLGCSMYSICSSLSPKMGSRYVCVLLLCTLQCWGRHWWETQARATVWQRKAFKECVIDDGWEFLKEMQGSMSWITAISEKNPISPCSSL